MEKTNDNNFVNHNSSKPFIRTMEDDLKKIKKGFVGSGGKTPSLSDNALLSRASVSPFVPSRSGTSPQQTPIPPRVPGNLPTDEFFTKKQEISPKPRIEANTEKKESTEKPLEKPAQKIIEQVKIKKEETAPVINKIVEKKEEKAPAAIPVKKPQIAKRSWEEELENLPPQARLAWQESKIADKEDEAESEKSINGIKSYPSSPGENIKAKTPSGSSILVSAEVKSKTDETPVSRNTQGSFLGKLFKFIIIVLIIAGIDAGAYYYYYIKKGETVTSPAEVSDAVSPLLVSGVSEIIINTDIDSGLIDKIRKYFSSAGGTVSDGSYRLVIKSNDGLKNLKMENFKSGLNIILPDSITGILDKDYNLIVFSRPKEKYLRLGLALKIKDNADIFEIARGWEPNMAQDLKTLFLNDIGTFEAGRSFERNTHGDFDIKYLRSAADSIALNYAISRNKKYLLIATSKEDIFYLIDKTIKEK